MARSPHGPTIKFQVHNVHTSGEVRLSGNCLRYSRPLLTFDHSFDQLLDPSKPELGPRHPQLKLMKELFIQTLGTPRNHPKSKPFHDHAMSFFYAGHQIHVRHYQISPLTDADADDPEKQVLTEVGPRMVLNPIWVLNGSFSGKKLWQNPDYLSPTATRRVARQKLGVEAKLKAEHKQRKEAEDKLLERKTDEADEIFEESEE